MKEFYKQLANAVLAGICIGIGGFINLKFGGLAGAIFFAFGLLIVVCEKYNLFTGIAGSTSDIRILLTSLFGNIIGCFAIAKLAMCSSPTMTTSAITLLSNRISAGPVMCFFLSIPCGFIVTAVVKQAKQNNLYYPLFLGVPIFIICGFPHCIADAFNYLVCPWSFIAGKYASILLVYLSIVLGNYVGCNLYRIAPQGGKCS